MHSLDEQLYILCSNYIRVMWLTQELIALAQMMMDDKAKSFDHN